MNNIYAGIVLYNPKDELYINIIQTLTDDNIISIIFDNSPSKSSRLQHIKAIKNIQKTIFLSSETGNIGLSAAYNCIIDEVLKNKDAEGIFIFDQDTKINSNAVKKILSTYWSLQNTNIGTISGYAIRENGIPYRIRPKKRRKNDGVLKRVKRVPSSFTFYPISTIKRIGYFQSDFFIDHIDIDYSLRCLKNNLEVYIDTESKYIHRVGNGDVIFFNKHLFPISDPYRHYYQIRNLILSYIRNKEKTTLIIKEIVTKILVVFVIGLYAGSFIERFKYLFLGIIHGILNKGGELNKK
jgi:rhamnosyltransferase